MAQNNIKYAPTVNNFNTTLNGAISSSATTIALNSVTGLQNKAGILVIDRVDSSGNLTPSNEEWVYFTGVSGSSVTLPNTTDGRGVGGSTAQSHADGAIVEAVFDVSIWGGLITSYIAQHTDAGGHTALTSDSLGLSSNASIGGGVFANTLNLTSNASISGTLNLTNLALTSIASVAQAQINTLLTNNLAALSLASASSIIASAITPSLLEIHGITSVVSAAAGGTGNIIVPFPLAFGEPPWVQASLYDPQATGAQIAFVNAVQSPVTMTRFRADIRNVDGAVSSSGRVSWVAIGKRAA